ncbi:hypothetical protein N7492_001107 [Penicillium capsulatum]|uniref:A to I editase domain-containing protein n=1 Tax=Penicillium capsulatum TaxID=69766 RepID=A0A9W9LZ46_9EURO|nr:hypothetical protein N7492_001107 [Penicillium capsulatum]KAJ6129835.1 hypothetical protein N7512_002615 [Penicillium capsulatum]
MSSLPSRIASLIHNHFDALPARSKPNIFPDGSREWIPMTGIVIVKGENTPTERLHCIAITTGAKCLAASHMPRCQGLVLHDCHAEILAIRAFNHWLLTECHGLLSEERRLLGSDQPPEPGQGSSATSPFIRRRVNKNQEHPLIPSAKWPPFEMQPDIQIYMYCTCAPCGDASMELCMAAQEDATPWEVRQANPSPASPGNPFAQDIMLDGRANFSLLGVVRRKPARTDAESTRSKSCSDKLALRQVSSLLSCETSHLIAPTENVYLAGLVLPENEISRIGCERSFGENGRMAALKGSSWSSSTVDGEVRYRFRPFQVLAVPSREIEAMWQFAKPKSVDTSSTLQSKPGDITDSSTLTGTPRKSKPGTSSAIWTAAPSFAHCFAPPSETGSKTLPTLRRSKTGIYETIINGLKQGTKVSSPSARGASSLSRAKLWAFLRDIVEANSTDLVSCLYEDWSRGLTTYEGFKRARDDSAGHVQARAQAIQDTKEVLGGWIPNPGDEGWGLNVLVAEPKKRKRG